MTSRTQQKLDAAELDRNEAQAEIKRLREVLTRIRDLEPSSWLEPRLALESIQDTAARALAAGRRRI